MRPLILSSLLLAACTQPGDWLADTWSGLPDRNRPEPGSRSSTPTVDTPSGTYLPPTDLTLTSPDPGAVIRYTTDGSLPTTASPAFAAGTPIHLDYGQSFADLRARAWAPNRLESEVLEAGSYTVPTRTQAPSFSAAPATAQDFPITVTLTCPDAGAEIWYRGYWGTMPAPDGYVTQSAPSVKLGATGTITVSYNSNLSFVAKAWLPGHDGSVEVESPKYIVRGWAQLGSSLPVLSGSRIALSFDGAGQPLLAYRDPAGQPCVSANSGSAWTLVGSAAASTASLGDIALTVDAAGNPLLAFDDGGAPASGYLGSLNGGLWGHSASAFSAVDPSNLALAYDGQPILAWNEGSTVKVETYDSGTDTYSGAAPVPFPDGITEVLGPIRGLAAHGGIWSLLLGWDGTQAARLYELPSPYSGAWTLRGDLSLLLPAATSQESVVYDATSTAWFACLDAAGMPALSFDSGSGWQTVPTTGFGYPVSSLAFAFRDLPPAKPWLAVVELIGTAYYASVYRYNEPSLDWAPWGGRIYIGATIPSSLAFGVSPAKEPYLAYSVGGLVYLRHYQ